MDTVNVQTRNRGVYRVHEELYSCNLCSSVTLVEFTGSSRSLHISQIKLRIKLAFDCKNGQESL